MFRLLMSALAVVMLSTVAFAQSSGPPSRWFSVETLNAGLGPTPSGVNRETPHSALETFVTLTRQERYGDATHLLDLSDVEQTRQAIAGEELARRLAAVIDRKIWLDWGTVPDRPDGLSPTGDSSDQRAGEPRRDIVIGRLSLGDIPTSIRLRRLKTETGDPVWVFARQTVNDIDPLFEAYGPSAFERAIPDVLKKKTWLGIAWWEMAALPLAIGLLLVGGMALYRLFGRLNGRMPEGSVRSEIVGAVRLPIVLWSVALAGWFLTRNVFVFSAPVDTFMAPIWTTLFVIAVLLLLVRVFDTVLDKSLQDNIDDIDKPENNDDRDMQTNLSAARRIALLVAFVAGAGIVLMQTNLFNGAGAALFGSAGVLTLILGFAGRSALSNIMSSLQIALSKSAKIGDAVLFEGQWCTVEKIHFTYIQLESWDSRRLIVPVNYFTSNPFENWTKKDPTMTKTVELRLNHMADVDALRERFEQFVQEDDDVLTKNEAKVQLIDHSADGMLLRFYADARDPSTAWDMQCRLREAMLKAAVELEPNRGSQALYLPTEREAKVADLT